MRRVIRFVCVLFALMMLGPRPAQAHATATSSVVLDVQPDGVEAEITLPNDQLGLALQQDLGDPKSLLARWDAPLRRYIGEHLRLSGSLDQAYSTVVRDFEVVKMGSITTP